MQKILTALMDSGVKFEMRKCHWFQGEVIWLGHKLSASGISPDPGGVAAVKNLAAPKGVPELRSMIGTLNYFKDYIDNYSELLAPLSGLLKNRKVYEWGEPQKWPTKPSRMP